jgi:hypothetical protein
MTWYLAFTRGQPQRSRGLGNGPIAYFCKAVQRLDFLLLGVKVEQLAQESLEPQPALLVGCSSIGSYSFKPAQKSSVNTINVVTHILHRFIHSTAVVTKSYTASSQTQPLLLPRPNYLNEKRLRFRV